MTDKTVDYSKTLFLPKTDFPMRAGLPQKEPEILARWESVTHGFAGMKVDKPVIFDCRVANLANCFPMIPSGKAHNEMLLPDEAKGAP